jgi:4-hydroxy-4-methyl-2-oxoglutarate aldolase
MAPSEGGSRAKIGTREPREVGVMPEVDLAIVDGWQRIPGLSSSISDILDELGYATAVAATHLPGRLPGRCVVGRAVTVRYLPERRSREHAEDGLIHKSAMAIAARGDVLVVEGDGGGLWSVFGGLAAHRAVECGIAGVIVDGAVRDLDQISALQLPVWSRGVTSVTGRGRLEGVGINVPVRVAGVQVRPGDVVVADDSGVCFVPPEVLAEVGRHLRDLTDEEAKILQSR